MPAPSRSRLALITGAAFFTGLVLRGCAPAETPPTATPAPVAGDATPGPTRTVDGAPAGFAHTEAGARAAAAAFVCTGQQLLDLDPFAAGDAVRQMAAAATADSQAEAIATQLNGLRDRLSHGTGPITYWQGVLAVRTVVYAPDRAQIAVWNVGVLSRSGAAPPQAGWAVSTVSLVWERQDWHLESETIIPGPAPITNDAVAPATSEALTAALADFNPADR